ncbi:hypothetical protein BDU57DRAFT_525784 [Ampelomyces quisqualis]|uniref:Uncharacterized protein n=1 Tax=Ampelomyces quisqualis TaxID=50730 RepID=A0A6A5R1W9_AMPQU|nr:hypothetical protein BDU57DRAFT_525784 [Ampelomyces quisqualis]
MGNLFSKDEADDTKRSSNEDDSTSDRNEPSSDIPHSHVARAHSGSGNPFKAALGSFNNKTQLVRLRARDAVRDAVSKMKELGFIGIAKRAGRWMNEHPWETAAIVVLVVFMVSTPAILAAMGFTTAGIAAGSTAAAIQSGIGSVVAGSAFAICQSAMMGGYGAVIFVLPLLPAAALFSYSLVWKWWNRGGATGVRSGSVGYGDGGGGGPGSGGNGSDGHGGEDEGSGSANAVITDETAVVRLNSDPKVAVQEFATDLVQVVQLGTIFLAANAVYRYRRWRQS